MTQDAKTTEVGAGPLGSDRKITPDTARIGKGTMLRIRSIGNGNEAVFGKDCKCSVVLEDGTEIGLTNVLSLRVDIKGRRDRVTATLVCHKIDLDIAGMETEAVNRAEDVIGFLKHQITDLESVERREYEHARVNEDLAQHYARRLGLSDEDLLRDRAVIRQGRALKE